MIASSRRTSLVLLLALSLPAAAAADDAEAINLGMNAPYAFINGDRPEGLDDATRALRSSDAEVRRLATVYWSSAITTLGAMLRADYELPSEQMPRVRAFLREASKALEGGPATEESRDLWRSILEVSPTDSLRERALKGLLTCPKPQETLRAIATAPRSTPPAVLRVALAGLLDGGWDLPRRDLEELTTHPDAEVRRRGRRIASLAGIRGLKSFDPSSCLEREDLRKVWGELLALFPEPLPDTLPCQLQPGGPLRWLVSLDDEELVLRNALGEREVHEALEIDEGEGPKSLAESSLLELCQRWPWPKPTTDGVPRSLAVEDVHATSLALALASQGASEPAAVLLGAVLYRVGGAEALLDGLRAELGWFLACQVTIRFSQLDYEGALAIARHMEQRYAEHPAFESIKRYLDELPRRGDDFKGLTLVDAEGWQELKARLSRKDLVRYLFARIRIGGGYLAGARRGPDPEPLTDFAISPQSLLLYGDEAGLTLDVKDLEVIAPFLEDDWMIPTEVTWSEWTYHQVPGFEDTYTVVAQVVNTIARQELVDFYIEADKAARDAMARRVRDFARAHQGKSPEDLLVVAIEKALSAEVADLYTAAERLQLLVEVDDRRCLTLFKALMSHEAIDDNARFLLLSAAPRINGAPVDALARALARSDQPQYARAGVLVMLERGDTERALDALERSFAGEASWTRLLFDFEADARLINALLATPGARALELAEALFSPESLANILWGGMDLHAFTERFAERKSACIWEAFAALLRTKGSTIGTMTVGGQEIWEMALPLALENANRSGAKIEGEVYDEAGRKPLREELLAWLDARIAGITGKVE